VCVEEQDDATEDHDEHGDVEYLGTSNGMKASDETLDTSADAGKDETSAADKTTTDSAVPKEPEPDFTVTPSKDGQSAGCVCLLMWSVCY